MIAAVVDTNVLASGFVRSHEDTAPVRIINAWRAQLFELVISRHILAEVANTLASPYFRRRLTPEMIAGDLVLLETQATVVSITVDIR